MSNEGGNVKIVTYFTYFLLYIRVEGGGDICILPLIPDIRPAKIQEGKRTIMEEN